jgi:hypothetical protein
MLDTAQMITAGHDREVAVVLGRVVPLDQPAATITSAVLAYRNSWLGDAEAGRFTRGDGPTLIEVEGWLLGLGISKDTGAAQHTPALRPSESTPPGPVGAPPYVAFAGFAGRLRGPDRAC